VSTAANVDGTNGIGVVTAVGAGEGDVGVATPLAGGGDVGVVVCVEPGCDGDGDCG
jgi:hypothetical protein